MKYSYTYGSAASYRSILATYLSHGNDGLLGIGDGGFSTASDDLLIVHHP
jgi:hypothetical protein